MKRRDFLYTAAAAPLSGAQRPKAPFKVLYSNDTTNIITCTSPYHQRGQGLTSEMIQATVDEALAADVHMLQPGTCWIPWWKSRVYPAQEHYAWVKKTAGVEPDVFGDYMIAGNDMVDVFVKHCRLKGQSPFVSFRLNDGHHLENAGLSTPAAVYCTKFYTEHPEYRIGPKKTWDQRVHNWAIPAVRDHKFSFIRELCESYDIDGLELDFMRHTSHFRLDETTSAERARIMTEFVGRVRGTLDATARNGRRRWLCARVPCFPSLHDRSGIDLPSMVEAGLDMVNASGFYFTLHHTDLAQIRKLVPGVALYLEAAHATWTGPSIPGKYDSSSFLRTTPSQYYTAAHLAYNSGADGMSLFNFVYYREHGTPGRGPFNEPPFEVLKHLGDARWVEKQPQWYVLTKSWGPQPLPVEFEKGRTHTFNLDLAPVKPRGEGLFRLRTDQDSSGARWKVRFNGKVIERGPFVARPIEHPYNAMLGTANELACFRCPSKLVRKGANEITVTMEEGSTATVEYLDLVLL